MCKIAVVCLFTSFIVFICLHFRRSETIDKHIVQVENFLYIDYRFVAVNIQTKIDKHIVQVKNSTCLHFRLRELIDKHRQIKPDIDRQTYSTGKELYMSSFLSQCTYKYKILIPSNFSPKWLKD